MKRSEEKILRADVIHDKIASEVLQRIDNTAESRYISILKGIKMAYAVGHDDGRKSMMHSYTRKVIQYNLIGNPIRMWDSASEAARAMNVDRCNIARAARGDIKTSAGYKWKYVEK